MIRFAHFAHEMISDALRSVKAIALTIVTGDRHHAAWWGEITK